jgi:hypothetical protein
MSRQLVGLPKKAVERKELDTIELIKTLRSKGFEETDYDRSTGERIFKKEGLNAFRINVRQGYVTFGKMTWSGREYANSITHIKYYL